MIDQPNFSGVIAPVLTPFGEDGDPDPARYTEHAEWLLGDGGCNALAPFGTTSEANSLGNDERMDLLEDLVEAGIDPQNLMPGTGTCSLSDTITLTQHAVDVGCGGVLMLPPFFYKAPSDDGLFQYFSEVIDEIDDDRLRVYLYHIPPISQVGFSLDLIDRLRKEFPEIVVGLKDSSGDWDNMQAILERFPDFELFPGSEAFLLDGLRAGGVGTISASANVNGAMMRKLFDDWQSESADEVQAQIIAIRKTLQGYPLIPVMKALMAHYRADEAWAVLRAPNMALDS
ncbi:MAG: 4-hydroxy-tetrahydrodipicolinate synthase, partial [Hyphomicrobiaceae bacterium]